MEKKPSKKITMKSNNIRNYLKFIYFTKLKKKKIMFGCIASYNLASYNLNKQISKQKQAIRLKYY